MGTRRTLSPNRDRDRSFPNVAFYGEAGPWPTSELVHSEPLVERSELHNWRIRPHQHSNLVQLFLLLEGTGVAHLDSVCHSVTAPSVLIIPRRCVHEFDWAKASCGYVLSITSTLVDDIDRQLGAYDGVFSKPATIPVVGNLEYVLTLFSEIHSECVEKRPLREHSLDYLTRALTVWLARQVRPQSASFGHASRANKHFSRFSNLVNEHHKSQWSVEDYANAIGITPAHLNSVCQKVAGKSALMAIHEQLILAARRDLIYTERTIAAVSDDLGFSDPSYFTRFFRRLTRMTPSEYRRKSGTFEAYDG